MRCFAGRCALVRGINKRAQQLLPFFSLAATAHQLGANQQWLERIAGTIKTIEGLGELLRKK